jgi:hypothetical protein
MPFGDPSKCVTHALMNFASRGVVIDAVWTDKSWHAFAMRFGTEEDNVYVVVAVGNEDMSHKRSDSVAK